MEKRVDNAKNKLEEIEKATITLDKTLAVFMQSVNDFRQNTADSYLMLTEKYKLLNDALIEERRRTNGSLEKIAKEINSLNESFNSSTKDLKTKFYSEINNVRKEFSSKLSPLENDVNELKTSEKIEQTKTLVEQLPEKILLLIIGGLVTYFFQCFLH